MNRLSALLASTALILAPVAAVAQTLIPATIPATIPTPVATSLGGTGSALTPAIGDLLSATSTTAFGRLADVATGQVLTSGGVGAAPAFSATPGLTSLALGGCTIGSNALCATGTANISSEYFLNGGSAGYWANGGLSIPSTAAISWGSTSNPLNGLDVFLTRDAANTLAQRNGVNAQAFRVYNTFTDLSNYERLSAFWSANVAFIEPEAAGTGNATRTLVVSGGGTLALGSDGTSRWFVNTSTGHFVAALDLTFNIGAPTSARPLAVYAGFYGSAISSQSGTTYTVGTSDSSLIFTAASTVTATLPAAASFTGRLLRLKTTGGGSVISASSNVVPLAGGAAGTAILAATAGKYAELQSDGANWIIMEAN